MLTILINDIIYDILHSLRKKKIWTVYLIKCLKLTFKLLYPIRVFMDFLISLLKNVNLEAKFGCIHNNRKNWRNRQFYLQWQLLSQPINTINHFRLVNVFTIFFLIRWNSLFPSIPSNSLKLLLYLRLISIRVNSPLDTTGWGSVPPEL